MDSRDLTADELRRAREWWTHLSAERKGNLSIWVILALYGRFCEEAMRERVP